MKRRIVEQETSEPREGFYEAMPVAERPVYRDPVYLDDQADRTGMSVWAAIGLVVLGILVLLLLFGRGGVINPGVNRTINVPTPTTSSPTR